MAGTTISQTVLQLLLCLEEGKDQRAALAFLLENAIFSTQAQLEAFLAHAPQNPELSPELAPRVESAMLELKHCFEQLKGQLSLSPGKAWTDSGRRLKQSLERLHQIQADLQKALQWGPTSHIPLNRLLLHLQAWESGATPGALPQDLIDSLYELEMQLSGCIEGLEPDLQPGLQAALAPLMNTCDEVVAAFQLSQAGREDLAEWRDRLTTLSLALDRTLALAVESQMAVGPTRLAAVNLVMVDLERFLYEEISAITMSEALIHCEFLLRSQLPADADTTLLAAADSVFSALQRLQLALETACEEELGMHRDNLLQAAEALARYASLLSSEECVLDLVSAEGLGTHWSDTQASLPLLLAEVLQQCNNRLSGQGFEGLEPCRLALQRLVSSTKLNLKSSSDPAPVKDRAGRTLEILDRVVSEVEEFRADPSLELYASIEELLYQAGELAAGLVRSGD